MYRIVTIMTRFIPASSTIGEPNRLHCVHQLTSVSSTGEHQSCSSDRGQAAAEPTLDYRECRTSHGKAGTLPGLCLACENTHTRAHTPSTWALVWACGHETHSSSPVHRSLCLTVCLSSGGGNLRLFQAMFPGSVITCCVIKPCPTTDSFLYTERIYLNTIRLAWQLQILGSV